MDRRVRISLSRGITPEWSADGSELFFVGDDQWVTAVSIELEQGHVKPGTENRLFQLPLLLSSFYAPADNGQRFLIKQFTSNRRGKELFVIDNWFEELKRVAPATE